MEVERDKDPLSYINGESSMGALAAGGMLPLESMCAAPGFAC